MAANVLVKWRSSRRVGEPHQARLSFWLRLDISMCQITPKLFIHITRIACEPLDSMLTSG